MRTRTRCDMRVSTRSRCVRFLIETDSKARSQLWSLLRYAPRHKCRSVFSLLSNTFRTSPMSAQPSSSSARRVNFRRFRKADTPSASKCQPLRIDQVQYFDLSLSELTLNQGFPSWDDFLGLFSRLHPVIPDTRSTRTLSEQ